MGKTKLRERARSILHRTTLGESLSGEDLAFMIELLSRHKNAERKVGVGVASIEVEAVPAWGRSARCFWLTRIDGSRTDFGIDSCLSGGSHEADVRAALRAEVADQVISFARATFDAGPVVCPVTGEVLRREISHVDHAAPVTFLALATEWLESRDVARVELDGDADGETTARLRDRALAEDWRAFHQRRAVLRVVSVRANLSLLRR